MDIRLSWDLFVLVFFGIVIAYSFIIGRNQTLKIIIASYMAILSADGIGNICKLYVFPGMPALQGAEADNALIILKIFVFVLGIVLIAIKGGFYVDIMFERSLVTRLLATLTFGFLNAGLIVSTMLVYISGASFVSGTLQIATQTNLYQESTFVKLMIDNYNIWFALPAIAVVLLSFFEPRQSTPA